MAGLPPGQHAVDGFPRFGTHLSRRAPAVPADPVIEVAGEGLAGEDFTVPLTALAKLPRRELSADFHCVAGWSATGLRWEGVAFETFYRELVEPAISPDRPVTHIVFGGLDGFRAALTIDDALDDEVTIAEHLDGRPLDADHGAPARLVSPKQYGYLSTKHLCRIELHTSAPAQDYGRPDPVTELTLRVALSPHPRARVWEEERHRHLPAWSVRRVYRLLIPPIKALCERGKGPTRMEGDR